MNNVCRKKSGAVVLLLCILLLTACNQARQSASAAPPIARALQASLEQAYAAQRAQQITNVDYELAFTLDETNVFFSGK